MTMVERVAMALLQVDRPWSDLAKLHPRDALQYRLRAGAAIEAMRDAAGPEWAAVIDAALDMPVRGDMSPAERDLGGEG